MVANLWCLQGFYWLRNVAFYEACLFLKIQTLLHRFSSCCKLELPTDPHLKTPVLVTQPLPFKWLGKMTWIRKRSLLSYSFITQVQNWHSLNIDIFWLPSASNFWLHSTALNESVVPGLKLGNNPFGLMLLVYSEHVIHSRKKNNKLIELNISLLVLS